MTLDEFIDWATLVASNIKDDITANRVKSRLKELSDREILGYFRGLYATEWTARRDVKGLSELNVTLKGDMETIQRLIDHFRAYGVKNVFKWTN